MSRTKTSKTEVRQKSTTKKFTDILLGLLWKTWRRFVEQSVIAEDLALRSPKNGESVKRHGLPATAFEAMAVLDQRL
jgi:hypothetical protein